MRGSSSSAIVMQSEREDPSPGTSTLVLVGDAEYELHASKATLVFDAWGSIEACGTARRDSSFSVALVKRLNQFGTNATNDSQQSKNAVAATPLVITAPLTSRFRLRAEDSCSLMVLLRASTSSGDAVPPLRFSVEFVPPQDHESDSAWTNFQDQVVIQTRLARLSVHLLAMRDARSFAESREPSPCTFQPLVLPSVKAPSFKLFEQIEKDAATAVSQPLLSCSHRPSVSGSFHPHKNPGQSLAPLPLAPVQEPVRQSSPSLLTHSRPSSSSDSRRTASPRVFLAPLSSPSTAAAPSVTSDVSNLAEAREVIRRLRSRRSSQSSAVATPPRVDLVEPLDPPEGPESRLDAKAKAELAAFNALVKSAKREVAGEMNRAKDELDFYKSLLPKHPVVVVLDSAPIPSKLPHRGSGAGEDTKVRSGPVVKKPARLPTLPATPDENGNGHSVNSTVVATNNQELSPVKCSQPKPSKAPPPTKFRSVQEPEKDTQPQHNQPPKTTAKTRPRLIATKPESVVFKSIKSSVQSSKGVPPTTGSAKGKTRKTTAKPPARQKIPTVAAATVSIDDALLDFDDADPEVDDAPWQPDDLHCHYEDEDEDDLMLTMKVPL